MKDKKKITELYRRNTWIYLFFLALLIAFIFIGNRDLGYVALGLYLIIFSYTLYFQLRSRNQWETMLEDLRLRVEEGNISSYLNMPLPILLVDETGMIIWHNSKFKNIFDSETGFIGQKLETIFPLLNWNQVMEGPYFFNQALGDKQFRVFRSSTRNKGVNIYTLYWYDETDFAKLKQRYKDERPLAVYIQLDNFDEVVKETDESRLPFLLSGINSVIRKWALDHQGIIHKINEDEYLVLVENSFLASMESRKFTIIDDVRKIEEGNRYPMTLSVGVSADGASFSERDEGSQQALELALGRGGDQVVVRKDDNYEFFGGRSKNVERKSRVKSRVVAQGLAGLIKESERVYIMGHNYGDMDSFASTIGMYRACLNLDVPAYIVLNKSTDAIEELYALFRDNKLYRFISGAQAAGARNHDKDLLIVVDTHRPNFTEAPELLPLFERIVVIDHHRRGAEMIENTSLLYQEPYASSAAEMISEILQYITSDVVLEPLEASALLSGIVLDTKNFVFNTGVRTFDAASFLRRHGADTRLVRGLFEEDLLESVIKSNIVSSALLIEEGIALSQSSENSANIKTIISQGADELIDIKGIHTSFVLGCDLEGKVYISARSLGDTNVQVILEKLGGGGHLETAGAQLEDTTIEEAKTLLLETIKESLEE
ncbi:MAG TPA: DHH family phosphoesterase [Clostridia bacterium]|nr:DHH family phosphoesterase [Clostridia bacterium]